MSWFEKYKVTVPEGESGNARISRFEVSQQDADLCSMRAAATGRGREQVAAGTYTKLEVGGALWMSDTPSEIHDHRTLFMLANGHVLLNGIGLGMALGGVLRNPDVEQVTATEISRDVLNLTYDHYQEMADEQGKILVVEEVDCLTWKLKRGMRFDYVWHDIWPYICGDNLEQMKLLHRKFGKRCGSAQASCCRYECERAMR